MVPCLPAVKQLWFLYPSHPSSIANQNLNSEQWVESIFTFLLVFAIQKMSDANKTMLMLSLVNIITTYALITDAFACTSPVIREVYESSHELIRSITHWIYDVWNRQKVNSPTKYKKEACKCQTVHLAILKSQLSRWHNRYSTQLSALLLLLSHEPGVGKNNLKNLEWFHKKLQNMEG